MDERLKPNRRYGHLFAIIRYDDGNPTWPIEDRVVVKKVVATADIAEAEVLRLNALNKEKGARYFYQVTRFDDSDVTDSAAVALNGEQVARA
jgi:hypothetical protein